MFIVAERTQRLAARWLFVLGCVVPTLVIAVWSVMRHHPAQSRALEGTLSAVLGAEVVIARQWYPRPGQLFLDQVALRDAATGSTILRASQVRAERGTDGWSAQLIDAHLLVPPGASIAQTIARCFPAQTSSSNPLSLRADSLTLDLAIRGGLTRSLTLVQWSAVLSPSGEVTVEARLPEGDSMTSAGEPSPLACRLQLRRENPGEVELQWDTNGQSVPAQLLNPALVEVLGPEANFRGTVMWRIDTESSCVELAGELGPVQLERMRGAWTPFGLWGSIDLQLKQCRIVDGRLESAEGLIDAQQLQLSSLLFERLEDFLPLSISAVDATVDDAQSVRQRIAFSIERDWLRVAPADESVRLAVRSGQQRAVWTEPKELHWHEVANLLLPPDAPRVPAVAELAPYLVHLMWPEYESIVRTAEGTSEDSDRGGESTSDVRPAHEAPVAPVARVREPTRAHR